MGDVQAIVPGGRGLIRDGGAVVLARGALPGERVEVEVERSARGVRHGVVIRVLQPSADRVAPDCPAHGVVAGRCGGCDLLALAPPAAKIARERIVDDALVRVGRLPRELVARARRPIAALPADAHPVEGARRRVRVVMQGGLPTLSSPESHARVPVHRCAALHPVLDEGLARLPHAGLMDGVEVRLACDERGHRSAALEGARRGDARRVVDAGVAAGAVVLAGRSDARGRGRGAAADDQDELAGLPGGGDDLESAGDPILRGEVAPDHPTGDGPARSDAGVFTQATRFGARAITRAVLEAAAVTPGDRVLELFAGSGHLTLPLLAHGAHVRAVEGAPRGARFLAQNVAAFGRTCTARRAFIDGDLDEHGPIDVLVADPPRTGIIGLAALLERLKPARLVLVSCDPATGARDLATAMAAGHALEWLEPIDAFPRTSHVEWVASLRRNP